jgi:site-specific recombinase XerD
MRGCRALTESELQKVSQSFTGKWEVRNRTLLTFLCHTGYRVSEGLSLRVGDVLQLGRVVDRVMVSRKSMKAKRQGRDVILHSKAKHALEELVIVLGRRQDFGPNLFLFQSQIAGNTALGRKGAWHLLRRAFAKCGITGKVACHSTRKYYAGKIYELVGHDLMKCQKSLGHFQISSTLSYLSFKESEIDEAVLAF